jgi:hypothetical protein
MLKPEINEGAESARYDFDAGQRKDAGAHRYADRCANEGQPMLWRWFSRDRKDSVNVFDRAGQGKANG